MLKCLIILPLFVYFTLGSTNESLYHNYTVRDNHCLGSIKIPTNDIYKEIKLKE